jgi:hypothetical protein
MLVALLTVSMFYCLQQVAYSECVFHDVKHCAAEEILYGATDLSLEYSFG